MGFLKDIGLIGEVAGGVALIASGGALGILAGGLLLGSAAASTGVLGGTLKGFANSAAGHDLVMAIGLATAAVSIESTVANAGESASSAAVNQGVEQMSTDADMANLQASPTLDASIAQNAPGASGVASSLTTADTATVPGGAQAIDAAQTAATQAGGGNPVGSVEASVNTGGASATQNANTQAVASNAPNSAQAQWNAEQANNNIGSSSSNSAGPNQSLLDKAKGALTSTPGMLMAGQAVSGLAQGISQQKMMQEQIAAQQYGNMTFNPGQAGVGALEANAAAPINVPQGYLNRANALRSLLNTTPGPQQTVGGQGAPVAPPMVAPVGMGGSPGGGPVPVLGMGATPRGGAV